MNKNELTARFKDAEWAAFIQNISVTVGGVGGIGSWLALLLSRMQCSVTLYDNDIIEYVNIGGQHYTIQHIGLSKEAAMRSQLLNFSENYPSTYGRFTEYSPGGAYMFSCFDNMSSRKIMFDAWKRVEYKNKLFVDGRMSLESFQVYFVTTDKIQAYEKTLFNDDEVPTLPCTAAATSHCGDWTACYMVGGFTNHISNIIAKEHLREVPFKVSYDIDLLNQIVTL